MTIAGGYDTSKPIAQIEDEIAIIEAGLVKLSRPATLISDQADAELRPRASFIHRSDF
jgi:hypothetical protein